MYCPIGTLQSGSKQRKPVSIIFFAQKYCGISHSDMIAKVFIQEQDDFDEWLESKGSLNLDEMPLPELGQLLYTRQQCAACHSIDGTAVIGPSFKGLYGANRAFTDGTNAVADDNYLRESILNPAARIVEGYPPVMPANYTSLTERELSALIAYIETVQ